MSLFLCYGGRIVGKLMVVILIAVQLMNDMVLVRMGYIILLLILRSSLRFKRRHPWCCNNESVFISYIHSSHPRMNIQFPNPENVVTSSSSCGFAVFIASRICAIL